MQEERRCPPGQRLFVGVIVEVTQDYVREGNKNCETDLTAYPGDTMPGQRLWR